MEQRYVCVLISKIAPNGVNPRQHFEGRRYEELKKSIKEKGVLQPILVRPQGKQFEIVFGESRYRCIKEIAEGNGGVKGVTIPALIRDMTDEEAFEAMTIENLQRRDLSPLEEAQSFRTYLDKKGTEFLPDLAQRTGISESYIRRRLAILELPETVLAKWDDGKLSLGQLEQFIRIKGDPDYIREILESYQWPMSARQLREYIDDESPSILKPIFCADGCINCENMGKTQLSLFEIDSSADTCHNPDCYAETLRRHLTEKWPESLLAKKYGTNGFRFQEEIGEWYTTTKRIWDNPPSSKCSTCDLFVSVISKTARVFGEKVCLNLKCDNWKNTDPDPDRQKNRAKNHGIEFREKFYQEALPIRFSQMGTKSAHVYRATLFTIYMAHHRVRPQGCYNDTAVWEYIKTNYPTRADVIGALQDATSKLMFDVIGPTGRNYIATDIGIDLQREWKMDEEYLQKKTRAELIDIGENLGIFSDPKVKQYIIDFLYNKSVKNLKKGQLIRIFTDSGVDLTGKVPAEILNF